MKRLKKLHLGKSNFNSIKNSYRGTKHNLNLPEVEEVDQEIEFEERIFKDIKNLGKYIISINIRININEDILKDYLQKYPHIIVYQYDEDNHRHRENITEKYK